MQKSTKRLKLWINRTAKFSLLCWCVIGFESGIENLLSVSEGYLEGTGWISTSHVIHSTSTVDNNVKLQRRPASRYSLEPGSSRRRIPDRFWRNSTEGPSSEISFSALPSKKDCEPDLVLLVLVKSAVGNVDQREAIRSTWGGVRAVNKNQVRILYLLGQPGTEVSDKVLNYLNSKDTKYDDVIVGNFVDAYTNVTMKSLMGLRFAFEYCRSAKFVLSVDDDVFVKLSDMILVHFPFVQPWRNLLQCGLQTVKFAKVARRGKWAVKYEKYNRIYYPPYCKGPCFLMSSDVATAIHEISRVTPTDIPIDDALITGVLREKIGIELSSIRKGLCTHLENPFNVAEKMHRSWNATLS